MCASGWALATTTSMSSPCSKSIGLLSEQPVKLADGSEVVPLKVVKACLPDPASLAPEYTGKTCIGDFVKGSKDGKDREVFIYNVADHKDAYNRSGQPGHFLHRRRAAGRRCHAGRQRRVGCKRMANVEELDPGRSSTSRAHRPADPHQGRNGDRPWDQAF